MFEDSVEKRDPITTILYCGLAPFAIAYWIHNSLATSFAMEAYLVSCCVFVVDPFEMRKKYVKQRWYWRIMLRAGLLIHPPVLIGLWFLDRAYPIFYDATGTIFVMAIAIAASEIGILAAIVRRFRPGGADTGNNAASQTAQ